MENSLICVNCFGKIDANEPTCPNCGYDNSTENIKGALPHLTILQGRYILGKVTLANSEGFTYLAYDKFTKTKVDIREFFPMTLAYREGTVICAGAENQDEFDNLYFEFVNMANSLLKIRNLSGILSALDLIAENETCYIVYEHHDSVSLTSYLQHSGGKIDYNEVQNLFAPLISSLSTVHSLGIKHLGISPETLRMCKDGKLRLTQWSTSALRTLKSPIEPDLIKSYAAYEQYSSKLPKSEYTDLYSFASCIFYALSGKELLSVKERLSNPRLMLPKELVSSLPKNSLIALAGALQIKPEDRTQSFESFKMEFTSETETNEIVEQSNVVKDIPEYTVHKSERSSHPKLWLVTSFLASIVILFCLGNLFIKSSNFSIDNIISYFEEKMEIELDTLIKVPDMVGDYYIDWNRMVSNNVNYKFDLVVEESFDTTIEQGRIINQVPPAGSSVVVNSEVTVIVSLGSKERTLPNIAGLSTSEAKKALDKEGMIMEEVSSPSSDIPAGHVMWYVDYNTGDKLTYGSTVSVYVSTG